MSKSDICTVRSEIEGHDVGHHFICAWYGREYWGRCKECGVWKKFDESLGLRNKELSSAEASRRSKEKGKRRAL